MDAKQQYYENIAKTIIKNMAKRQMQAYYCPTKEGAVAQALALMPEGALIGWGGSVTLKEVGIFEAITNSTYRIIDRDKAKTAEEKRKVYAEICGSDFFLTSTNAVTLDGELINIDGRGNRVAFICFGPENVLVFVGMNKLVSTVDEGINRSHNMAAAQNAVRLNTNTPCRITGSCNDCYSPESLCSHVVITRRSHIPNRIKVILIGEELGF